MQPEDPLPQSLRGLTDGEDAAILSAHSSSGWSPNTLCATQDSTRPDPASLTFERAPRSALCFHAGRALTDFEWAQTRARLLEFARIVRSWQETTKLGERKLGNV